MLKAVPTKLSFNSSFDVNKSFFDRQDKSNLDLSQLIQEQIYMIYKISSNRNYICDI